MRLSVETHLLYATSDPCDLMLQIEAASDARQICDAPRLSFGPQTTHKEMRSEDGSRIRRWVKTGPVFECHYSVVVELNRGMSAWATLVQDDWVDIPADVIEYMVPSRYCHSDQFLDFVSTQFPNLTGGPLVLAMTDWINQNFTYDGVSSTISTTATESFHALRGVCRDYAHVLITFSRAAGIPARFVSIYAPYTKPQDFHAVVEVYLDGAWHLIDPTKMARADQMVRICAGRDAADTSFLSSYGWMNLKEQSVSVKEVITKPSRSD